MSFPGSLHATFENTGAPPVGTRWVDINKGDEANPNYRSSLVGREFNNKKMDNLCNDCNKVMLHKCRRRRQSKRRIPSVRTSIPDELGKLITQLIDDEVHYVKILKEFLHMEDVYRMDVPFSQRNNLLFESPSFLLPIYKLHQNYLLPLLKTVQTCDQVREK